jgi:hypothetical protein
VSRPIERNIDDNAEERERQAIALIEDIEHNMLALLHGYTHVAAAAGVTAARFRVDLAIPAVADLLRRLMQSATAEDQGDARRRCVAIIETLNAVMTPPPNRTR